MSANSLSIFISYAHQDMEDIDWLDRLKRYLAPLRQQDRGVVIWDDTHIRPGSDWSGEIGAALDRATAAILLVGPGFLASDFIRQVELPALLDAAKRRGTKIYPLVIGYCRYNQSELAPYQAFNDPNKPLEDLERAEQNKILNDISLAVDEELRHSQIESLPRRDLITNTREAMKQIAKYLANTGTAFQAQARRRDAVVEAITDRLQIEEWLEYENFFFRYYGKLNDDERFQFDQIRAITEGPLHEGNENILGILDKYPQVIEEIPRLADLRQHLVFWLNKYDRVFSERPEMCVLYTGVEDHVPFPNGIEDDIDQWLKAHK